MKKLFDKIVRFLKSTRDDKINSLNEEIKTLNWRVEKGSRDYYNVIKDNEELKTKVKKLLLILKDMDF